MSGGRSSLGWVGEVAGTPGNGVSVWLGGVRGSRRGTVGGGDRETRRPEDGRGCRSRELVEVNRRIRRDL